MVELTFQTTPPGAEVFLDSADTLKITPVTFDIFEGTHDYLLRMNRYEDLGGTITVVAGNSYILEAMMQETSVSTQQQFNEKMIQLGWAGVAIATIGIIIALMQSRKKA
jgi:uncharacterized protein YjfI (DUF2170 family)